MTTDSTARIAAIREAWLVRERENNQGRTHWEGCETDRTHRDCAIRILLDLVTAQPARRPLEFDNHHNALLCAYCNPDNLVLYRPADINALREQLTAQQAQIDTWHRERDRYEKASQKAIQDLTAKAEAAERERDEALARCARLEGALKSAAVLARPDDRADQTPTAEKP